MKKGFLLLIVFCSFYIVLAHPTTYNRTKKNLLVPSDVDVTESKINDILKTPAVDASKKVYDFSDLLTEDEEEKLLSKIKEFNKNTGLDAVIITTNNLDGFTINNYAYNFYDYNDFLESGVTFVIYNDGSKTSIFMGNNGPTDSIVFTLYTNSRTNEILKYVYENHIRSGNYYKACDSFLTLIDGFYIKTYGVNDNNTIRWGLILIISCSLTFIIVLSTIVFYSNNSMNKNIIENGLVKDQMIVKCLYDKTIE